MMMGSFYFKTKAKEMLKGNWQTAMLVAFFSGILGTVLQVLQMVLLPNQMNFLSVEAYTRAVLQVPQSSWIIMLAVSVLTLLASPALGLGCNHYFVRLAHGEDLGVGSLFSRFCIFGKALWLYLRMFVQIFLWSLLLFIPGIIAAIRYSMAPYYLAENPDLSAGEALQRSKAAMANQKMSYFSLVLSFYGWMLLAMLAQTYLGEVNYVLGTVVGLAFQVWIAAYQNAAIAQFFGVVGQEDGVRHAYNDMFGRFEQMGMDPETLDKMKAQAEEVLQKQEAEAADDGTQPEQPKQEEKWSLDDEDKLD